MALDPETLRKQEGQPGSESTETEGPSLDEKLEELPDEALEAVVEEAADRTEEALVEVPGDAREQAVGRLEPATQPAAATIREKFRDRAKSLKLALVFSLGMRGEPDQAKLNQPERQVAGSNEHPGEAKLNPVEPPEPANQFGQVANSWFAGGAERSNSPSVLDNDTEPLSPAAQRLMARAEQMPGVDLDIVPAEPANEPAVPNTERTENNPELVRIKQEQLQVLKTIKALALQIGLRELTPILTELESPQSSGAFLDRYNTLPDLKGKEPTNKNAPQPRHVIDPATLAAMEERLMVKLANTRQLVEPFKGIAKPTKELAHAAEDTFGSGKTAEEKAYRRKRNDVMTIGDAVSRNVQAAGDIAGWALEKAVFSIPAAILSSPEKVAKYAWALSSRVVGDVIDVGVLSDTRRFSTKKENGVVLRVGDIGQRLKLIEQLRSAETQLSLLRDQYNSAMGATPISGYERAQTALAEQRNLVLINQGSAEQRAALTTELLRQRIYREVLTQIIEKNPDTGAALIEDPTAIDQLVKLGGDGSVELQGALAAAAGQEGVQIDAAKIRNEHKYSYFMINYEHALREAAKYYLIEACKQGATSRGQLAERQQQVRDGAFTMDIDSQGRWVVKLLNGPSDEDPTFIVVSPELTKTVFSALEQGQVDPASKEIDPGLIKNSLETTSKGVEIAADQKPLVDLSSDIRQIDYKLSTIISARKELRQKTPDAISLSANAMRTEQAELVNLLKGLETKAGDDVTLKNELAKQIIVATEIEKTLEQLTTADDDIPELLALLGDQTGEILDGSIAINQLLNGIADQQAVALLQRYAQETAKNRPPLQSKFGLNDTIVLKKVFPGKPVAFKVVAAEQNYYRLEYATPVMDYVGTMVMDEATLVKYQVGDVEKAPVKVKAPDQTKPIQADQTAANRTPDRNSGPDLTVNRPIPDVTTPAPTVEPVATPVQAAAEPATGTGPTESAALPQQPNHEAAPVLTPEEEAAILNSPVETASEAAANPNPAETNPADPVDILAGTDGSAPDATQQKEDAA